MSKINDDNQDVAGTVATFDGNVFCLQTDEDGYFHLWHRSVSEDSWTAVAIGDSDDLNALISMLKGGL